jgi:hypothetical protein
LPAILGRWADRVVAHAGASGIDPEYAVAYGLIRAAIKTHERCAARLKDAQARLSRAASAAQRLESALTSLREQATREDRSIRSEFRQRLDLAQRKRDAAVREKRTRAFHAARALDDEASAFADVRELARQWGPSLNRSGWSPGLSPKERTDPQTGRVLSVEEVRAYADMFRHQVR